MVPHFTIQSTLTVQRPVSSFPLPHLKFYKYSNTTTKLARWTSSTALTSGETKYGEGSTSLVALKEDVGGPTNDPNLEIETQPCFGVSAALWLLKWTVQQLFSLVRSSPAPHCWRLMLWFLLPSSFFLPASTAFSSTALLTSNVSTITPFSLFLCLLPIILSSSSLLLSPLPPPSSP